MDKNIANAMLLRLNKQDQIEALKSIGFTTVNENTPASDIAKYMQWSGTLLDLSLGSVGGTGLYPCRKRRGRGWTDCTDKEP